MKNLPTLSCAIFAMLILAGHAQADGIRMTADHHFLSGTRCSIVLSAAQIAQLESQRTEDYPLHAAKVDLTADQTHTIQKRTGRTITELDVFEDGWNDCSCGAYNIASRYKPDRLEVTSDHLTDTAVLHLRARAAELYAAKRVHWWQFWHPRFRTYQDAEGQALRESNQPS